MFQIARDSFQEQMGRMENLERKAQINLVIIGIVLSFGFFKIEAISGVLSGINIRNFAKSCQIISLVVSFFCFAFSLIFSFFALFIRDFRTYPDLSQILEKFKNKRTEDLHNSMILHLQESIQQNEKALKSKIKNLRLSMRLIFVAFIGSIIFVVIGVVLSILHF